MNNLLLKKITNIWNKPNRRYNQKTFTKEELDYMGNNTSKFIWDFFICEPVCKCGSKLVFISLNRGYRKECVICSKKTRVKNTQKTMKEKYGIKSVFQNKEIHEMAIKKASSKNSRKKAELTKINNKTTSKDISYKAKITKQKLYGDENYNNRVKAGLTKLNRYGDENYNNRVKAKQTMQKLYNEPCFAKTDMFRKKFKGNNNGTRRHFRHLENFNDDFIKRCFVNDLGFDLISACEYFGCSYNAFKNKDYYSENIKRIGRNIEDNLRHIFDKGFIYNIRSIIKPFELDFYHPVRKFAIEYNGIYWHTDLFKDKNYHFNKTVLSEKQGIQLFHIFENEWLDNNQREIWKSVINGKLNLHDKIGARECEIKRVDREASKKFLMENHLQGNINSTIRIGLFYNDELVSVMTFGKPRFNKKYDFELLRFASKKNTTIVGGGSKILKYFEKKYIPKSLISYANRRWSKGNFYKKVGFCFIKNTPPNYFYSKDNKVLESRYKFQKHKLSNILEDYDDKLTEKENMKKNGYNRIYDSGNMVFIKEYI